MIATPRETQAPPVAVLSRVNELDLLRFFAALAVVFHHYSLVGFAADSMTIMPYEFLALISKYGYLGVELFFMISGFVILMTASSGSLKKFAISRLIRLYPAFWACCTITFLVTLVMRDPEYTTDFYQYIVNMTMLSGFFDVPSMDSVYWSLFVELQFYALIAILLLLGRIHQAEQWFMFWLAATILQTIYPSSAFEFIVLRDYSSYFIAGATFFMIWSKGITWVRCLTIAVTWYFAVYQSISEIEHLETLIRNDLDPFIITAVICVYFVMMIFIVLRRTGKIGDINWTWLGALTYPLYLIHQNVGYMIYDAIYKEFNPQVLFWSLVLSMIMFAYLIHVFIEKPLAMSMKSALNRLTEALQVKRLGNN